MQESREIFARRGMRCTRQRLLLFEALRHCRSHPTAEELYRMLAVGDAGDTKMSRATVYNTLETLSASGLIRRIPTAAGISRFDGDTSDHLHVSIGDDDIRDVPAHLGDRLRDGLPQDAIAAIEREMGVKVTGVHIQFTADPAD